MKERIEASLDKAKTIINQFMVDNSKQIEEVASLLAATFANECKVYLIGTDESFFVAERFATLLLSKASEKRPAYPAILLSPPSLKLDIMKNYSSDMVYSRQIDALIEAGDMLIIITQSPDDDAIVKACKKALALKANIILLTGKEDGRLSTISLKSLKVPIMPSNIEESNLVSSVHLLASSIIASLTDELVFRNYAKE